VQQRNVFTQYGPVARKVLETLLDKYADEGITTIEGDSVLSVPPFPALGRPGELVKSFGGRQQYLQAVHALERELYAPGTAQPPSPQP
jgi:type I restriction enzyme R subunit